MPDSRGRYINDIVDHPSFERIRSEILSNVDYRARESQQAFNGLMTFCGVIYSGATVAILSYIGTRAASGVPYLAISAFALLVLALISFAIFYQAHSQLMAGRHYHYSNVAQDFFTRKATIEEVIAAGAAGQVKYLYRLIFWIPLCLAILGFVCGGLGALGIGPMTLPLSTVKI